MNPKEEAIKLRDTFFISGKVHDYKKAQKCAHIHITTLIDYLKRKHNLDSSEMDYLIKVKIEIEKL